MARDSILHVGLGCSIERQIDWLKKKKKEKLYSELIMLFVINSKNIILLCWWSLEYADCIPHKKRKRELWV